MPNDFYGFNFGTDPNGKITVSNDGSGFFGQGGILGTGISNPIQSDPKLNFQAQDRSLGNGGMWGQSGYSMAADASRRQASSSPWEAQQMALGQALARQMSGQDSISREQLRQDAGRNISMQQAMAASAGPQNAAMAQRMASQNAGRINQGLAGQTAMAGIMERNAAANAMGQLSGQARGQDMLNFYQNRNANDAMWGNSMNLGFNAANANLNAQVEADRMRLEQAKADAQRKSAADKTVAAAIGGGTVAAKFFGG